MKPPICLLCALLVSTAGIAQDTITTDKGEKIILLQDGTWKKTILKPVTSTESTPILKGKARIYYDPTKWSLEKKEEGIETYFDHISGEAFGKVVSERITFDPGQVQKAALKNLKDAGKNVEKLSSEKRVVNGLDVQVMFARATINGVDCKIYYYLFTGKEATIQVITGCAINLFDENKADFDDFMNGLTLQD